jgi:hypothetical protein
LTYDSLLVHKVQLQTYTSSQNALGEWLNTYTTTATPISCRMSPISAMERMDLSGRFDDVRFRCFCTSSAQITVNNRLVYNGKTYRVKESILESSYHHKIAYLTELE